MGQAESRMTRMASATMGRELVSTPKGAMATATKVFIGRPSLLLQMRLRGLRATLWDYAVDW